MGRDKTVKGTASPRRIGIVLRVSMARSANSVRKLRTAVVGRVLKHASAGRDGGRRISLLHLISATKPNF